MARPELFRKAQAGEGRLTVVPKNDPHMQYVSMDLLRLKSDERYELGDDERELGVVVLGGHCSVSWDGTRPVILEARSDPFAGWPHAIFIPVGKRATIQAHGPLEAAIFGAPADKKDGQAQIIRPDDLKVLKIGKGNWYLEGTFIIYDRVPSQRLIVGETHIPAGNWCSSPPHSHERDLPGVETMLEEIYYFRFKPPQGFGFQGVYTLDGALNEAYIIRNGDVVLVPRGMHPNVAGPGYEMYMLWGMAGPRKEWIPFEDPDHKWLGSVLG
jgi:5-deoxy-glucuronate isomerase